MGIYGGIQLPNINEENLDDKKERKQILNYLALLDEKLRYMFQNIDIEENLSEESKEMFLEIGQEIKNLVQDTDGRFSMLTQTVDGINTLVSDPNKGLSAISQKADSIRATVNGLNGTMSEIRADLDGISLSYTSDSGRASITIGNVTVPLYDRSGVGELVEEEVAGINLDGYVTFSALKNGEEDDDGDERTVINGNFITTGKVKAEYINLGGWMEVHRTGYGNVVGGYIGYSTGDDGVNAATNGIALSSTDKDIYMIATTGGVRMTADDEAVVVTPNGISTTDGVHSTSDARAKNTVSYNMERYEEFFKKLQPSYYKMNNGKSGRFHVGFVAQDVESAIIGSGLTTKDFAGLVQHKPEEEQVGEYPDQYYLRYNEFIALNTHMIQKLMARVSELESKLEALS